MAVINTNVKALFSQNALTNSGRAQSLAMQQMSTGKRINSARDDAAGMAIATRMTKQIRGLNQAVRNASDAINLIQTAEGATNEITNMMQRMRELAVQAVNDTNDNAQRSYLDLEFQQLKQQIVQISNNTEWNGFPVLDGTAGERVGEMPVFKVTSENQYGSVFIEESIPALRAGDLKINGIDIGASYATDDKLSPVGNAAGSAIAKAAAINRMAVATGVTQGEAQMLTFSGTPAPGTLTVAGVSVTITALDTTTAAVATKVAAALQASPLFASSTGRVVTYIPGNSNLTIKYAPSEGNMPETVIQTGATGVTGLVDTVAEHFISSAGTGVFAKVNENVMTGRAMTGTSVVKGTVFINGFASADITTVLNNSRETRANVVRAINLISDKTGVKAIDTGVDAKGITLTAADGRNIEVSFETNANGYDFGSRIGLRQGVQSSTISLESKIPAPVVLSSDSTGDIKRAGLISGNFSKNEAVANTSPRAIVGPNVAQVESVTYSGTVPVAGDTFSLTVNGTTFTYTANATDGLTTQAVRNGLVALVNANTTLPVTATAGRNKGEILLTADSAGTSFTLTNSKSNATTTVTAATVKANAKADFKSLGMDDLVINGVKIPASTSAGDVDSNTIATSSDPASSALAIAAAINSQTPLTGVLAKANGAEIKGTRTVTSLPLLSVPTFQSLFINGTEIKVQFVQNESATDRLNKVAEAINQRSGAHGVVATNNGNGISLKSDGRNMSVWFDSNVKDLSAANFGLDQGGAVAQVEKIQISDPTTSVIPRVVQTSTYIEFSNYGTNTENMNIPDFNGYDNGFGPASVSGVISFFNNQLYRGNGIQPIVIGSADSVLNGTNGKPLRINYENVIADPTNIFYNTSNQHYYELVRTPVNWVDAISLAANKTLFGLNGYLATITSQSEQDFLNTKLSGSVFNSDGMGRWIGASDVSGAWKWVSGPETGTTFTNQYSNWNQGEPTNLGGEDYLMMWSAGTNNPAWPAGTWNDSTNTNLNQYIVEYGGVGFGSISLPTLNLSELTALQNKVSYTNSAANTDTASVSINGITVTSDVSPRNVISLATNLQAAINAKIDAGELRNISVQRDGSVLTIQSTVPGSSFDLRGAASNYVNNLININEVTSSSYGNNLVTGIRDATPISTSARTAYGTVRMIAQAPILPSLPKPIGVPPSKKDKLVMANAKPFTVTSGDDGFGPNSNFSALGFNEGSFGGRSSSDMDPPKVGRLTFQVGPSSNQTVTVDLADFGKDGLITGEITGDIDQNIDRRAMRINTRDGATAVLAKLDSAMDKVNATRATLGAVMNRLDHVINNMTNVSMNLSTSRSSIEDADYASSSTELAKTQIMQQAATAVLAQANSSQQTVLKLLQT
jgi:flagellin